jgi:hypothetical protein
VHEIYPKLEPQNPSFGTGGLLSDFVTISWVGNTNSKIVWWDTNLVSQGNLKILVLCDPLSNVI